MCVVVSIYVEIHLYYDGFIVLASFLVSMDYACDHLMQFPVARWFVGNLEAISIQYEMGNFLGPLWFVSESSILQGFNEATIFFLVWKISQFGFTGFSSSLVNVCPNSQLNRYILKGCFHSLRRRVPNHSRSFSAHMVLESRTTLGKVRKEEILSLDVQ